MPKLAKERGAKANCAGSAAQEERAPNAGEILIELRLRIRGHSGDEWYAFCLPRPELRLLSGKDEDLRQDVVELYRDLLDIQMLLSHFIKPLKSIIWVVLSWRWRSLSAAVLIWLWFLCYSPFAFLQSLPLAVAGWLFLLRSRNGEVLLAHAATAPLSDEGFRLIASFGDSSMM